jgi:hypothetical protein
MRAVHVVVRADIKKGSIYFQGNEKFIINGLHGVLAFYIFYILGCFGY